MLELFLSMLAGTIAAIWICAAISTLIMTQELLGLKDCIRESPKALCLYLAKGPVGAMDLWWVSQRVTAVQDAERSKMQQIADIKTKQSYLGPDTKEITHFPAHSYYN